MAQFNVPQFNQMLFGGNVYTRTLTAIPAIGLSAILIRSKGYTRTLTASPAIGLSVTVAKLVAFLRIMVAPIALGVSMVYKSQNPRRVVLGVGTDREVIAQRKVTTGTF